MASTFYEVLGVSRFATDADIKKAYKALAKKYHPDKHPGEKFYEEHFKKINEAHQTLSNPQSRQRYDLLLNYNQHTPPPRPQYKQTTNQHHTSYQKQAPYTNYKRPQASRSETSRKKLNKYYVFIGIGAIAFIIGSIWFYNFMNDYAAKEYYAEGLKEELKGNNAEAMGYFFSSLEKDLENPIVNEKVGDIYTKLAQNNSLELFYFDLELQRKDLDPSLNEESENLHGKMREIDSLAGMYYNRSFENYTHEEDKRRVGIKRIRTHLKIGNYNEALSIVSQIITYPDSKRDDSLLYYEAEIAFHMKNFKSARSLYSHFYQSHPSSIEARVKSALCHYNEKNEDYAIGQLNNIIERFPNKGEAYYFKGEIARRNHDSISACNLFHKADSLQILAAKSAIYNYCQY